MTKIANYESPRVFSRVELSPETSILQSSIHEAFNVGGVDSMGQGLNTTDFSTSNFQHEWK